MSRIAETMLRELRSGILGLLFRLWSHLGHRRQQQVLLLLMLMVASAFFEVVSLGAILPFLGVLTAQEGAFSQPIVAYLARAFSITTPDQLVMPLALLFAGAALAAGGVRLLLLWTSNRLAFAAGADFSSEVYQRALYQPYCVQIARNSSEVISGTLMKVGGVVSVLQAIPVLASSIVLLAAVTIMLIFIDPIVASAAVVGFGGSYGLVTLVLRRRIKSNSERIACEYDHMVKALQEGLGGIRDVILDGAQPTYCETYRQYDVRLRKALASNAFVAGSPRIVMEALGMALIAALAYGLSLQPGGVANALPMLGALVLGAQRMLPALQNSYSAWVQIAGTQVSLAEVLTILEQPLPEEALRPPPSPLVLEREIRFDNVRFSYGDDGPWVLDGVSLTIKQGTRVGFVGSTGSGKTTTLDLLMGLLDPTEGQVLVDGETISGNRRRAWQLAIAHVPQSLFLADTTFAENIAFGVPRNEIDMKRMRQAAKQAQIDDFIERRPGGYEAVVGERGIRLSGGQRQRIGIARALYKRASVFVFDEATSALDNETERAVMEAIEGLDRDLTIAIIAHRLTTVQHCDQIIEFAHGRIVAIGTYEELLSDSGSFRKLEMAEE